MMIWLLVLAYCLSRCIANLMQSQDKQWQPKTTQPSNHPYTRHTPFAQALLKCHSSQYPLVMISLFSVAETVKTWMAFENSFINSSVFHAPEKDVDAGKE
jgi:hypothetical protein